VIAKTLQGGVAWFVGRSHREGNLEKEGVPDMDITDYIIRAAIFGVLAAVLIGTFQNLYDAVKNRGKK
jgi:hypothetical protein